LFGREASSKRFSTDAALSDPVVSKDSSELLEGDASPLDFEAPNMAFNIFHLFLGGGCGSEDVDSGFEELLLTNAALCSCGAAGTTRSNETNRLEGEKWLSHRMMMILRPGAGVQGAEDSGTVRSSSALTWKAR
jgi:hypothetical protein